jgi:polyferredoxin/predicted negative regulator of RcsB-dependent stress response
MKSGCENRKAGRSVALPVLKDPPAQKFEIRKSKTSRWRAIVLIAVNLLMAAHFIQWYFGGNTVSPIEPSETMYTLERGAINAGMIFFVLAITATLVFGRFVCGWGCHIVALQDFCAWLLKKIGITPKPFKSRLLVYVPLLAALYMFVFPTALRFLAAPKSEPLFPKFTNHLTTTDFWATFPPLAVAIPFLFICGFLIVYFLGSKGFCTYACPYGGVFGMVDKLSPGKIRVTDACNQCGHCTATCTSNVLVHAEVAKYGMVVDPGCMKCMDCISVCPNDALYFGFGKPSIMARRSQGVEEAIKNYPLTWVEEIAGAVIFLAGFLAVWDVYQLVPMLMALGIAAITTFLALRMWKLFRNANSAFLRFSLKSSGMLTRPGWIFLSFAFIWIGLNAHSGWIRYNERAGLNAFQRIQIYDEMALARPNPKTWLTTTDRENVTQGLRHLQAAADFGLFANNDVLPKLAWLEYLSGDADRGVQRLGEAANHEQGQALALTLYYRGAILNRLRRYDEALTDLDQVLAQAPDLILAREERGESLWQLGRKEEAISAWKTAIQLNTDLPLANYLLAAASASQDQNEAATQYETQADLSTPDDAAFHYMIGLRLENLRFNALAEKHFQRAIQLDPQFRARRNLDLLNRL